jgi:oxygen-independent coproporphyrinogen-3 oxidase
LERIGRKHTTELVEKVYEEAKEDFDVNMDLIAMLPGETLDDFKHSVDRAVELDAENVTVHTLYLKKGSQLKVGGYQSVDNKTAEEMVDYAYTTLTKAGYEPYYMYRQKYTSGNLENVGYAKKGKLCVYNVDIMEEDTSILAAGAAAISKKWDKSINLITRNANYKEPLEYVKHFDVVMDKQRAFWLGEDK